MEFKKRFNYFIYNITLIFDLLPFYQYYHWIITLYFYLLFNYLLKYLTFKYLINYFSLNNHHISVFFQSWFFQSSLFISFYYILYIADLWNIFNLLFSVLSSSVLPDGKVWKWFMMLNLNESETAYDSRELKNNLEDCNFLDDVIYDCNIYY
jgi:hypothetical protein